MLLQESIWDWQFVIEIIPLLLEGLKITVAATLVGFFVAAILGLLMALGRRSTQEVDFLSNNSNY